MFNSSSHGARAKLQRWLGQLISLIFCAAAAGAHAQSGPGPLTLAQALTLAEDRSSQLLAQDAATRSAREAAVAAGKQPDPVLRFGLDALPINGADRFSLTRDDFTMRTIGITQEWTREAKRRARTDRFERQGDSARATRSMDLTRLQRDTAIAWFDRYFEERIRDALVAQRDESRLQIEATEAAYRGGRGSQADVLAARSAVALVEDRIDERNQQVANATVQLARWVGAPAAQSLAPLPPIDTVPIQADTLESHFDQHPEVAVMIAQEQVAQADVDLAVARKQADWTVGLSYAKRGPAYSDYIFLSLSVPLQWDQKNRQDREVAAKAATVEQLRAAREDVTRAYVADALAMLQEWHTDRQRLERFDATLIPLAAQRTRAALAAYRGGGSGVGVGSGVGSAGNLTTVLEARRAEIDTRIDRLLLERAAARLWARLTYLFPAAHGAPEAHP